MNKSANTIIEKIMKAKNFFLLPKQLFLNEKVPKLNKRPIFSMKIEQILTNLFLRTFFKLFFQ
jgi:hypothetical protein